MEQHKRAINAAFTPSTDKGTAISMEAFAYANVSIKSFLGKCSCARFSISSTTSKISIKPHTRTSGKTNRRAVEQPTRAKQKQNIYAAAELANKHWLFLMTFRHISTGAQRPHTLHSGLLQAIKTSSHEGLFSGFLSIILPINCANCSATRSSSIK